MTEKSPCTDEKNVCHVTVEWSVCKRRINSMIHSAVFHSGISLFVFPLNNVPVCEKGVFRSHSINKMRPISQYMSSSVYFVKEGVQYMPICICNIFWMNYSLHYYVLAFLLSSNWFWVKICLVRSKYNWSYVLLDCIYWE